MYIFVTQDIFALFSVSGHAKTFNAYLSFKHSNIDFPLDEKKRLLFFLEYGKFKSNVYGKLTIIVVYTDFYT